MTATGADKPSAVEAEGNAVEVHGPEGSVVACYSVAALIDRLGAGAFPYAAGAKRLALLDGTLSEAEAARVTVRMRLK